MDHEGLPADVNEYVEHLAFTAELGDGTPVRVRPLAPKDRERVVEGWEHLSAQSRFLRFMQTKSSLTQWELTYLTEIDYDSHFAWGAEALDDAETPGVGIARYIRDPDVPTVAEAAIAVVDDYQSKGLGRILFRALSDAARANGIERFRAHVHPSNKNTLGHLTAAGAVEVPARDGMATLEVPLPDVYLQMPVMYESLRELAAGPTHDTGHSDG